MLEFCLDYRLHNRGLLRLPGECRGRMDRAAERADRTRPRSRNLRGWDWGDRVVESGRGAGAPDLRTDAVGKSDRHSAESGRREGCRPAAQFARDDRQTGSMPVAGTRGLAHTWASIGEIAKSSRRLHVILVTHEGVHWQTGRLAQPLCERKRSGFATSADVKKVRNRAISPGRKVGCGGASFDEGLERVRFLHLA